MKKEIFLFAIIFHLVSKNALAEEFNYNFIRGGSKDIPEILNSNGKNASGKYFVDVIFNGSKISTSVELNINEEDSPHLCLSVDWLKNAGISINKEFYKSFFNVNRECYNIEEERNSQVDFDPSLQELSIDMPQAGFIDTKKEGGTWDYGSTGFKLAYDLNTSKSSNQDRTTYGNIEGQINIGEWVLLGRGYAYQGEKFQSNNLL